jgi:hypothetical protein
MTSIGICRRFNAAAKVRFVKPVAVAATSSGQSTSLGRAGSVMHARHSEAYGQLEHCGTISHPLMHVQTDSRSRSVSSPNLHPLIQLCKVENLHASGLFVPASAIEPVRDPVASLSQSRSRRARADRQNRCHSDRLRIVVTLPASGDGDGGTGCAWGWLPWLAPVR